MAKLYWKIKTLGGWTWLPATIREDQITYRPQCECKRCLQLEEEE